MATQLKNYEQRAQLLYKKAYNYVNVPKRRSFIYYALLAFAIALLLATTVYAGYQASNTYSTDSNAVILTQQFSKGISFPVVLPGPHATLIIIPLIYLQGHLPYHYTSFTIVNIGLVLVTMVAWAFLLIKLFGRRYEIPILILLSSLIFTAVAFSLSIGYTTIRNIEYPIALWFVMIIAGLLKGLRYSRKQLALAAIGSILFSIVLAGDSFFNYAIILPLLVVIAWYWVQSREFTMSMVKAIVLMAAVFVGADALKLVLSKAGIIHFDYSFWGPNVILSTDKVWQSVGVALQQLLQLHGAYIFGQVVNYHNVATFFNFGLVLASIVGLGFILRNANRSYRNKEGLTSNNDFVFAVMAVSYFVAFIIYALSGYAIATLPSGQIVSDQNARYISIMPFISVIALVWLLKNYYKRHIAFIAIICAVLVVGIATSHSAVSAAYSQRTDQLELAPSRTSINNLIGILKNNDVTEVSADYWYGPIIRFWSNSTIGLAQQVGCSPPVLSTNANEFIHQKGINTALVIDRGGLNYDFWTCTDPQLLQFYGTPTKEFQVQGAAPNTLTEIWIYDNASH